MTDNSKTNICEHCGYENPVGALICRRCYRLLTQAGKLPGLHGTTDRLGTGMLNQNKILQFPDDESVVPDPEKPFGTVLRLRFVGADGDLVKTFRGGTMLIGREDNIRRIKPDIDLNPYGAFRRGVSRTHALLRREGDRLLIQDLDSANHTFVNGKRLQPNMPHKLQHKDKLRLGVMLMEVLFE
ncbi:MAG: FHA domain-containing protein [Chloroflexota bacterium]